MVDICLISVPVGIARVIYSTQDQFSSAFKVFFSSAVRTRRASQKFFFLLRRRWWPQIAMLNRRRFLCARRWRLHPLHLYWLITLFFTRINENGFNSNPVFHPLTPTSLPLPPSGASAAKWLFLPPPPDLNSVGIPAPREPWTLRRLRSYKIIIPF